MAVANVQRTTTTNPAGQAARRKLSGPQKAAILFLCLGEKRGSALMQQLDDDEIQRVTRAMSGLGSISSETVEQVLSDFVEDMTNGGGVVGSFAVAENLLRSLLPGEQVEGILKDIRGPLKERDLWARFSGLSENVIANYLKGEHEQTIAAILTNVKTDVAAKVLPLLGPEKMNSVVERMIRMEAVPHHMMRQIEESLQSDIINAGAQPTTAEQHQRMADLFNKLDRGAFDAMAPALETSIPDSFAAIKAKMFTFEDLVKLEPMDLARIMRGVPGNTLPTALRGASQDARDAFLNALPGRSRDMLMEEMESMGPVRRRDVTSAQTLMLDYARTLADEDQISLPLGDEDDEMY
ncbi:flagellar motor switch protein FliG [Alloyangia pacifica]|uniref:Flagellar motor switch protein FliG n=1 Tax=Alloyangia pacifica TaxID=311180 RepID=A0A1I6SZF5_9RHOB|nr:flagellar motor switch protein FliG [Alloyangia pacifica]SDG92564.1 flagellar motor switch protein FliG [Alloyangia pacifica]SFS82405.1 flagellar motor switch protein FliG [Alloyangia pacifica]